VSVGKRHTKHAPCPICEGHPDLKRGTGTRCAGWTSDDGNWVHCSREEFAGRAKYHAGSLTYSHALDGRCPCGEVHGDGSTDWRPPGPRNERVSKGGKVQQIGDTDRAKIVATYEYQTGSGKLLYEVCRTEPKSFRQRRPDGKGGWLWNMKGQPTTLYRLPELLPAVSAGDTIYVVEGEKDVEAIRAAGGVGTCNTGGAGKWRDELAGAFKDAFRPDIRIIQDRDAIDHKGVSGQQHARTVFDSLTEYLPDGSAIAIFESLAGHDAADHLAAGHSLEQFVQVWPIPDDLLERDPAAFKRHMLHKTLESPRTVLTFVSDDPEERAAEGRQPLYRTGLTASPFYSQWRGCVAISGEPSAGKSYVAISTAVDAAIAGWDVYYLSCEMHQDLIRDRAARAVASHGMREHDFASQLRRTRAIDDAKRVRLPETWNHIDVGLDVTVEMIVEMLADHVSHRPTLVVFDSLSSFVDSMCDPGTKGDTFGMADLRHVTRWLVGTRKLTHGHLAFLLLSELNKEGRAKGRFLDHRCDTALSMKTDPEESRHKTIEITKNWWGMSGTLGTYFLDWELGRLVYQPEDVPTGPRDWSRSDLE
jgi:hypothetical protein